MVGGAAAILTVGAAILTVGAAILTVGAACVTGAWLVRSLAVGTGLADRVAVIG